VSAELVELPEQRRALRTVQPEDRFNLLGSFAAALALTFLLCRVLLPVDAVLGFVAVFFLAFVCCYAAAVSFTQPGPYVRDRLASVVAHSLAGTMLLALVVVVAFTFKRGASALLHWNFLTQDLSEAGPLQPLTEGGVLHAVVGTLVMITIALVLTVPVGILAAVYLSESRSKLSRLVRTIVEAMTALPSVIAGLFVYALIITGQRALGFGQKSGLAASVALSVMMLPIVIRAADVVLRLVPGTLKEAAAALGGSRWRIAWHVVMPTSRSGLMTAIILGTARGIGETSPVLLTAGYATAYNWDPFSGPMVSLPLATFSLTRSPEPNQIARGFGAAAVLMLVVLLLFVLARVIGGRGPGELTARQRRRVGLRSAQDLGRFDGYEIAASRAWSAGPLRPPPPPIGPSS